MTPPAIAEAIIAVSTPPPDYESVSGDLYEEYVRRSRFEGCARADAWYWSQAVGSIPSLLSYSRTSSSAGGMFATALIVLGAIVGMLSANELIGDAIHSVYRTVGGVGAWPFFLAGWLDAACFGALIAALRRSHGMRLVLISALTLIAFIAVPIALRVSSPLGAATWILVFGAAVSMSLSGAAYHLARRRFISSHT